MERCKINAPAIINGAECSVVIVFDAAYFGAEPDIGIDAGYEVDRIRIVGDAALRATVRDIMRTEGFYEADCELRIGDRNVDVTLYDERDPEQFPYRADTFGSFMVDNSDLTAAISTLLMDYPQPY